jgi:hypothetical protein
MTCVHQLQTWELAALLAAVALSAVPLIAMWRWGHLKLTQRKREQFDHDVEVAVRGMYQTFVGPTKWQRRDAKLLEVEKKHALLGVVERLTVAHPRVERGDLTAATEAMINRVKKSSKAPEIHEVRPEQ